jgi:Mg-chelatase subunit ChlI
LGSQEAAIDLGGEWPVVVPYFMREILEQITIAARKSKFIDQQSGVSARFSIANLKTVVASARQRGVRLGEKPAVPRISDLGHIYASSLGKLELDLKGMLPGLIARSATPSIEQFVVKMIQPNLEKTVEALAKYLDAQQSK